jgi:hypothetical protein
MKLDSIKQFSKLRDSLFTEKGQLERRLSEINVVLGRSNGNGPGRTEGLPRGRGRGRNGLSLKAAIIQATAKKALTKEEILAAVKNAIAGIGVTSRHSTFASFVRSISCGRVVGAVRRCACLVRAERV